MRKKSALSVLVGALALAVVAVATASPLLDQKADVKLNKTKVNKSTSTKADLVQTDPGATPPGNFPAATKVVITLPPGTKANNNAAPQCNLSETEVANGTCPKNTKIGGGTAVANVTLGPQGPVIPNVQNTVTAYNRKGAVAFRVVSQATPTLPSVTIPIISKLTKKGVLTTNVPILRPAGPNSKVILTEFHVTIKAKTKTLPAKASQKGGKKPAKKINLLTTPKTCKGSWTTKSAFDYDDGTHKDVTFTQKCTKPAKKN